MSSIQKPNDDFIFVNASSFTMLGDPGCDGLGALTMQVFATALSSAKGDFVLINGDIVPVGDAHHYGQMTDLIDSLASKPVYTLCGNHDTGDFKKYFGNTEYVLVLNGFIFIALDNSKRVFCEKSLKFLENALLAYPDALVVLGFHIPPPNNIGTNTIDQKEWDKVLKVIAPFKKNIKYIVCGHVHSGFTDDLDAITLVVTGGAGAKIEDVSEKIPATSMEHHLVEFFLTPDGALTHQFVALNLYQKELNDEAILNQLSNALAGELKAHLRYQLYAERTQARGLPEIAKRFRALALSEYRHAVNFFSLSQLQKDLKTEIADFISGELYEFNDLYDFCAKYAKKQKFALSEYAFKDAKAAEAIHAKLLLEVKDSLALDQDIACDSYQVCNFCGYTASLNMQGRLDRCPVCGAPIKQITSL